MKKYGNVLKADKKQSTDHLQDTNSVVRFKDFSLKNGISGFNCLKKGKGSFSGKKEKEKE